MWLPKQDQTVTALTDMLKWKEETTRGAYLDKQQLMTAETRVSISQDEAPNYLYTISGQSWKHWLESACCIYIFKCVYVCMYNNIKEKVPAQGPLKYTVSLAIGI